MNVFNVHVNRIPVSGKVVWLKYIPGTFLNASLDKSSENNERMIAKIQIEKNNFIYVVQIAGLVARRIKCELTENQLLKLEKDMVLLDLVVDLMFIYQKNSNKS